MITKLFAAKACAGILRIMEKNGSAVLNKSRLLNHPFVQLERGFVFIHVPKAAGTSVRVALGLNAPLDTPAHASARDVMYFIRDVAPGTKAIAFVRNPYTRFVSLYNFARQGESLYHSVSNPEKAPYGKNVDYDILQDKSLDQCAELLVQGKLGGYGSGLKIWQPQVEWLVDRDGQMMVDFIGHVETLNEDMETLRRHYGIVSAPMPRLNQSSPSAKVASMSARALDLVRIYYQRDFEMLGYDESHLPWVTKVAGRVLADACA